MVSILTRFVDYLRAHSAEMITRLLGGLFVFAVVAGMTALLSRAVAKVLERGEGRGRTLAPIMRTLVWLIGLFAAIIGGFDQIGIDVRTMLAGAGVVGLAIGFGAQAIVKDCLSGFFLIMDSVLMVGDEVEIEGERGVVERVGLRLTLVRAESGRLWYIPNGSIVKVGNDSRDWVKLLVDVDLPRDTDTAKALEALRSAGTKFAERHARLVLHPPEASVHENLETQGAVLRIIARVKPVGGSRHDLRQELHDLVRDELAGGKLASRSKSSIDEADARPAGWPAAEVALPPPSRRGAQPGTSPDSRR
jgi:moderate conductance mechanosensitive channel